MKKKNILKIAIPSAIVLTTAAILCGAYYGSDYEEIEYPDVIGHTQYCTHPIDQEYTEPTVTPGKYYLNGDINSCYMEVTKDTWQIIPTETYDFQTLYSLERSAFIEESLPDIKTDPDEIIDIDPNCNEDTIAYYSKPHEYTVVTWHPFDIVWICPGPGPDRDSAASEDDILQPCPQSYWENGIGYPGPVLKDEKTIQSYGGDYILIE